MGRKRSRPKVAKPAAQGAEATLGSFPSARAWGSRLNFRGSVTHGHGRPMYSLRHCDLGVDLEDHVAAVGGGHAAVYHLAAQRGLELVQLYVDEDDDEEFYCCEWALGRDGAVLLCVAGYNSQIKVIDCSLGGATPPAPPVRRVLQGHGNQILSMARHPSEQSLLLTASKDESARLWQLDSGACVAIFAGHEGHRQQVLSCAWHPEGRRVATAGMDQFIKVWNLDTLEAQTAIADAMAWDEEKEGRAFPTLLLQIPEFSTRHVHSNYVDCVAFVGNLLLSKSTENALVLWAPAPSKARPDAVAVVREFSLPRADIWFVKFAVDPASGLVAVGNNDGCVCLSSLYAAPGVDAPAAAGEPEDACVGDAAEEAELSDVDFRVVVAPAHRVYRLGNRVPIRDVAMNVERGELLFSCEDGSVWRFSA